MGKAIIDRFGMGFPWGTFAVNVAGSVAIGLILQFLAERAIADPVYRYVLVIGFLGGFTTFSSFAFESVSLLQGARWARAGVYIAGTNLLCLGACWLGMVAARRFA